MSSSTMATLFTIIKDVAIARYRDIAEQRMKTYRLRVSPEKKLYIGAIYSLVLVVGIALALSFYPRLVKIQIDYGRCIGNHCSYEFKLYRPTQSNVYIYTQVKNMPQTHLAYRANYNLDNPNTPNVEPYLENGQWIYPAGLVRGTYPRDKYTLYDNHQNSYPIPTNLTHTLSDQENTSFLEWKNPSSFRSALTKVAEIEPLPAGTYTLVVEKTSNHPEPSRAFILITNIGPLGAVFAHIGYSIMAAAAMFALINTYACTKYL
ncbi:hypothetical protein NEHOM01_1057 [Nematocida homosporus]|uniref:uncharacterized protein n=1 Tax=Nematocida homosporus TaxID=1912981 RepID=UPI00221F4D33|nr:uncharacterized protein NEHOM01_1057 [Nematocida homosporus]KAI5185780.1 hypothetical protein NEHOM01_1057 [Nematocida homosporus]